MAYTREIAPLARAEREARVALDDANYAKDTAGARTAELRLQQATDALLTGVKKAMPDESIHCLALIKPGSNLAKEWRLDKPSYAIYEYDKGFGSRELRWGDGSSHEIDEADHADLILLPQFDQDDTAWLFED